MIDSKGSVVIGDQRPQGRLSGLVVVPDRGGQGQDALQDPDPDPTRGPAATAADPSLQAPARTRRRSSSCRPAAPVPAGRPPAPARPPQGPAAPPDRSPWPQPARTRPAGHPGCTPDAAAAPKNSGNGWRSSRRSPIAPAPSAWQSPGSGRPPPGSS